MLYNYDSSTTIKIINAFVNERDFFLTKSKIPDMMRIFFQ